MSGPNFAEPKHCLAFIWLAGHHHSLFYFTVDFSINNVVYCVERKGDRRRALMIAISKDDFINSNRNIFCYKERRRNMK